VEHAAVEHASEEVVALLAALRLSALASSMTRSKSSPSRRPIAWAILRRISQAVLTVTPSWRETSAAAGAFFLVVAAGALEQTAAWQVPGALVPTAATPEPVRPALLEDRLPTLILGGVELHELDQRLRMPHLRLPCRQLLLRLLGAPDERG